MNRILKDNIIRFAKEKRVSIRQLEIQIGIADKSIAKWDKSAPSIDKVEKIADFFGVTIDSLVGRKEETYSAEEKSLVSAFRNASADDKATIEFILSKYKKANIEDSAV